MIVVSPPDTDQVTPDSIFAVVAFSKNWKNDEKYQIFHELGLDPAVCALVESKRNEISRRIQPWASKILIPLKKLKVEKNCELSHKSKISKIENPSPGINSDTKMAPNTQKS